MFTGRSRKNPFPDATLAWCRQVDYILIDCRHIANDYCAALQDGNLHTA